MAAIFLATIANDISKKGIFLKIQKEFIDCLPE